MNLYLCSLFFIFQWRGFEFAEESISSFPSHCGINEALPTIKKIVQEEKAISTFCKDHLFSEKGRFCNKPSNCADLFHLGFKTSGVYMISPDLKRKNFEMQVYCDMKTNGGGWTVFQRRGQFQELSINFTRNWTEYGKGFGNLLEEFWLGNENIYILSSQENMVLRVDLEDFSDSSRYAEYEIFNIAGPKEFYQLTVDKFSGDAGDSLYHYQNGSKFVTYDMNDEHKCAEKYKGGWWYRDCHQSNLNGLNLKGKHETFADGINWYQWHGYYYSLKQTEMKIRPQTFIQ